VETLLPPIKETLGFFLYTMIELTVLFVGISFLVGIINEFLPQEKVKHWLSGRRGRGYLIGSLLGGLTPFCSCSTIPVTLGLLRAGAGFGPTMAFLFTSPLVNPVIVPLFITLLGIDVTIVYVGIAIGMTIMISFILEKAGFSRHISDTIMGVDLLANGLADTQPQAAGCCAGPASDGGIVELPLAVACCESDAAQAGQALSFTIPHYQEPPTRWWRILNEAVKQFRALLPFVVLGVAIGSIIHGFLPADMVVRFAGENNPLAVPASAVIGVPLYLRVSTMVPIASSLVAKGMSLGAVTALIIGGAGASLPEIAMLKGIFKLPLLIAFIVSVMVMAVSAGFLIHLIL
jgi:uncharacterized protein